MLSEEAKKQIRKVGEALSILEAHPAYLVVRQFEEDALEDLKTQSGLLHIDELYSTKLIHSSGQIKGVRSLILKKKEILETYRSLKEEPNVRGKPIQSTYGS